MMRKPHHCRYAACPGERECYCEMEREATHDMRQAMRMLAFMLVYAAVMAGLIAFAYLF